MSTIRSNSPSKRKLIRDTKKIKVSFGQFRGSLIEPRTNKNLRTIENKNNTNLVELENELLEQSQRLKLLKQVETSGLINGNLRADLTDLDALDNSYLPAYNIARTTEVTQRDDDLQTYLKDHVIHHQQTQISQQDDLYEIMNTESNSMPV